MAIPVEMGFNDAMNICREKLNGSSIPDHTDLASLHQFVGWYNQTTGGSCYSIWTPFSDKEVEDTFVNLNTNSNASLGTELWDVSEPNGGEDQNYVRAAFPKYLYRDNPEEREGVCSACVLERALLLRLDGLCEDSFIGDIEEIVSLFLLRHILQHGKL